MASNQFSRSFETASIAWFERQLYDEDFLDSNCELPFDEATAFDNLDWTVYMSFVIFGVTLLAGIAVWLKSERKKSDRYIASALIMVSLSYGLIPGMFRMLSDKQFKGFVSTIPIRIALVIMQVAHMLLTYVGVRSISSKLAARDLWAVINVIAIICGLLNLAPFVLLVGVVSNIFMIGVYMFQAIKKDPKVWTKVLATAVGTFAFIIGAVLTPTCGNQGYENCFEDCPLPNAKIFNHFALQIAIFTISFLLLAIGEFLVPASSLFVDMGVNVRRRNSSVPNSARLETVEEEVFDEDQGSIP